MQLSSNAGRARTFRLTCASVAAIVVVASSFAIAAQAQSPMVITASPQTFAPGDTTTVTGDQCGPDDASATNHQIIATLVEVATGVAYGGTQGGVSATGTWSLPVTADAFAPAGAYEIRLVCQYIDAASGVTIGVAGPATSVTVASPVGAPTMTVTPSSGVRPLTVTVTGSSCGPTDATVRTVTIELLDPSLVPIDMATVNGSGGDWSTTFVITTARINPYTARAVCTDATGAAIATYPDQRVTVTTDPPTLSLDTVSALPEDTITATIDRCPDPELPRLGGLYFVEFTFEPGASTINIASLGDGTASASFVVPAGTAPGTYTVSATCNLEELGIASALFSFPQVSYVVTAPGSTATPVPTTTPAPTTTTTTTTTTPTPTPSPTPSGSASGNTAALAYSDISALPTPAAEPATIAAPTAEATLSPAAEISFTG